MSMPEAEMTRSQQTPETSLEDWTPEITLLPHHAVFSERMRSAITRMKRPKAPFLLFLTMQRLNIFGDMIRDEFGTSAKDIKTHLKQEAELLDYIEQLPDETKVSLDLEPDDFCKLCAVGKHCMATNYKVMIFPHTDTITPEQNRISEVHAALLGNGYKEGEDFVFRQTTHTFYDFGGGNFKNVTNPQPVQVNFNSMIVKMGTLRRAIQTMPNV